MTPGEWVGWSAVALGFLGLIVFCWAQGSELDDLRGRVDLLEEQRGNLQADLTEGLARIDSLPFGEPATRPQPIVRAVPTDTAAVDAVLEQGLAAMAGAMAGRGRHRKP